jgi:predicted dehydrogenase
MNKLGVAVVGAGWMGELHALAFAQMPQCKVLAVADIDMAKAESVAKQVGAQAFADYDQALEQPGIQAVSVCTPDHLHFEPVMAAVHRGQHVIVEKPLTTDLQQGEQILEAVAEKGVKLTVGHLLRFDPRFLLAKKAIENGDIGEVVHCYARRNDWIWQGRARGSFTNPAFYLGVHDIDAVRWLFASEVEQVFAQAPAKALAAEGMTDGVLSLVRFQNGACAFFEFCWILPPTIGRADATMEILGTNGSLFIDSYQGGMRAHTDDSWTIHDTMYATRTDSKVGGDMRDQIESFVDAILEDKEPAVSGQDALAAVRIARAMLDSSETGQIVTL